jgi:hypothetical protein
MNDLQRVLAEGEIEDVYLKAVASVLAKISLRCSQLAQLGDEGRIGGFEAELRFLATVAPPSLIDALAAARAERDRRLAELRSESTL